MATAFLHSQDCLRNFRSSPRFNKPPPGPNPTPKPVPNLFSNRPRRKRRSGDDQSRSLTVIKLPSQNNLVIGRVKILKHGEAVLPPSLIKKEDASEKQIAVCSSNVESDNVDFFAGTAFSSSPPPSAVPLPRFLAINYGWRCRAKLAVRGTSTSPLIGLYQEGTHNVVDIPHCKAHHPRINAAVELLRQGIKELNVEPYDEDERTGDLRYVQMAVTTYNTSLPASERYRNGKVQITLVWNSRNEKSPSSDKLESLAKFLWRNGGSRSREHYIHSVWANFQTSTNNVIFGNRWRHLLGETDFWENVGGIDISLAPSSFGQANTRAFDILLRKLQKYVPYGASVTDLYAGAGVIGLSLAAARKCRSVKCVEINKESQLSFEKTVSRLPESVDGNISWHNADNSIEPLSWLVGSDVLVVDPPRKGLDSSLVHALQSIGSAERKAKSLSESSSSMVKEEKRPWILRAKEASVQIGSKTNSENQSLPQTLIYISCGWESFKEDCKSLLSSKAWHLEKAHGFNFFPGTQSIEVLAVFKRGQGLKKKKLAKKKKKNAF